jgi:hypothetical protein
MTEDDLTATVDTARTVSLDTAWAVAVCIDPDGEETFWVLSPNLDAEAGCACARCAPHEQAEPFRIGTQPTTTTDDQPRT